jgi:hypothetical protein
MERISLTAGSTVRAGFYFNLDTLDLIAISGRDGTLPGAEGQRCYRIPVLAALLLGPLLGGIFPVVMAGIGLAWLFQHFRHRVLPGLGREARLLACLIPARWRRGKASLSGQEAAKASDETDANP